MKRRLILGLLILVSAMASVAPALGSSGRPVLGWTSAFRGGKGFGTVEPATVYLGGDPTGEVAKLRWRRWGSGTAVGYGQGWCPGPSVADGHVCATFLHVFDLASCHGRRAYRMMTFSFRSRPRGRWTAGTKVNVCTGQFVP